MGYNGCCDIYTIKEKKLYKSLDTEFLNMIKNYHEIDNDYINECIDIINISLEKVQIIESIRVEEFDTFDNSSQYCVILELLEKFGTHIVTVPTHSEDMYQQIVLLPFNT